MSSFNLQFKFIYSPRYIINTFTLESRLKKNGKSAIFQQRAPELSTSDHVDRSTSDLDML